MPGAEERKVKELFGRISEEKRNRILEASINEFAHNGYEHANINVIAASAGVSVGSIYKYFENKQDLFLTTVKHCALVLKSILEGVMQNAGGWKSRVRAILHIVQKHSREHRVMIQLYSEMAAQCNAGVVLPAVEEMESISAELYSDLIRQAQREHIVREDCDPKMLAFLMDNLFMMFQFSYACDYYRERFKVYVDRDIFERDDFVVDQTMRFLEGAFAAIGGTPGRES